MYIHGKIGGELNLMTEKSLNLLLPTVNKIIQYRYTNTLIAKFFNKNPDVFTIITTFLFCKNYFYKVCPACAANIKPDENNYLAQ